MKTFIDLILQAACTHMNMDSDISKMIELTHKYLKQETWNFIYYSDIAQNTLLSGKMFQ